MAPIFQGAAASAEFADTTTEARCGSVQGSMRCVGPPDHYGPHWANFEGNKALRWGVVEIGCCDNECNRGANHDGHHRNGKGRSWVYVDENDNELSA